MNILTKICVVLLMLVSLVASVTFINYARERPSWKYYYTQEREARKVVYAKYVDLMKEVRNLQTVIYDERQERVTMLREKQNQIDTVDAENRELRHKNLTLTNQLQAIDQELKNQASHIKSQDEQKRVLNVQLQECYKEEYRLRERNTELNVKLENQKARGDRLEKSLGVVKDQSYHQKITIDELSLSLVEAKRLLEEQGLTNRDPEPKSEDQITGSVVAISGDTVSVNVGSAHGVKPRMTFIIHRGGEYVGELQVLRVEVSESAGILKLKNLNPMQGDRIINRLDLGSGV